MESKIMEDIISKSSNIYEAIRAISLEARRINEIIRHSEEEFEEKPTTLAMERFAGGKVKFRYEEKKEESE